MSLLREIQEEAVDPTSKISDLLRKCKILAYRLGNEDFKKWVESELNGYSQEDILPSYRVVANVGSKGNFVGSFGSSLSNADMPLHSLPETLQDKLIKAEFHQPIATLESFTLNQEGHLSQSWNPVILAQYGSQMYSSLNCIQAWKVISVASLIGIVDTVKTRVLNFSLEIESINPKAGEAILNSNPIPQDRISQIFNISISGNVQNLASGNHQSTIDQNISNNISQDFLELLSKLKSSDLDNEIATQVANKIENLSILVGTPEYKNAYTELMNFASSHVTVFAFLAPYIAMLTSYLN